MQDCDGSGDDWFVIDVAYVDYLLYASNASSNKAQDLVLKP